MARAARLALLAALALACGVVVAATTPGATWWGAKASSTGKTWLSSGTSASVPTRPPAASAAAAWFGASRPAPPPSLSSRLAAARGALTATAADAWDTVRPGGRWHPAAFMESNARIGLEACLAAAVAWLLAQRAAAPRGRPADAPLTEGEIDSLCDEWEPEPLVPSSLPDGRPRAAACGGDAPALTPIPASRGAHALLASSGRKVIVAAGLDFLGMAGDRAIAAAAAGAVAKYGVGSCGPRGFYGTIDVHLALEAAIAAWQGTEEAIVYSHDLATMPSVLPAFASAKDVIVLDDAAPWALRNGAALSRARVATFRHGDVADLERVLTKLAAADAAAKRPLCRRFIVVEGVATHTGGLAPLPAIVALKKKFKYRLVVDESLAAGVLGPACGRGACEHWGLAPGDADVIVGSLGAAVGSAGGWCAASREVVDHQRLSGLGYCFSASLPPFLAVAATEAVRRFSSAEGVEARLALARNAGMLRELLAADGGVPGLGVVAGAGAGGSPAGGPAPPTAGGEPPPPPPPRSPTLVAAAAPPPPAPLWFPPTLHLAPGPAVVGGEPVASPSARGRAALLVKALAADCLERGGVLAAAVEPPPGTDGAAAGPSLRLSLSAAHSEADVRRVAAAVRAAARRCCGGGGGGAGGTPRLPPLASPPAAKAAEEAAFASPRPASGGLMRQESQQSLGGGW